MNNHNGQLTPQHPQYPQYPPKKKMGAGAIAAIILGIVAVAGVIVFVCVSLLMPLLRISEEQVYDDSRDDNSVSEESSDGYAISEMVEMSWQEGLHSVSLEYNGETVTFEFEEASDFDYIVKINGKATDLRAIWVISIQIIDNTVIIATGGTDIKSTTLYALDMNGKILLEVFKLEDNGMRISDEYSVYEIIDGDTFLLRGSRTFHGHSLLTGDGIAWNDEDPAFWSSFSDDEVVEANYEMQYLGNGQFGPIVCTEVTMTFAQYRDKVGS